MVNGVQSSLQEEIKLENHERDIGLFKKAYDGMIAKNEASWSDPFNNYRRYDAKLKDYTLEEVDKIINEIQYFISRC